MKSCLFIAASSHPPSISVKETRVHRRQLNINRKAQRQFCPSSGVCNSPRALLFSKAFTSVCWKLMCTILVRSSLLGHVTGGTNGLFSIFRRLIEGQQGLGCWYYSSNTQLCILTDMATPLLSCHHAMNGRVDEEQLSGRTWPGYIDAAQKLLEMMLTISINLSVTSTISKSSLSLHN